MDGRSFKNGLYQQFARVGKALASQHRIEMMELLAQRERTVESMADELGLSMGNTSAHLQVLREARLVEARKEGLFVHYRVADDMVLGLLESLRKVAGSRLAEVDRLVQSYLSDRRDLDEIGFDELRARLKAGSVILVDVRPAEEYAAGHIAGAVSIPHDELGERLRELPKDREVVAYCRGPYCVFADQAIAILREKRRKARRLTGGLPEWKTAGLAVEIPNGEPRPPMAGASLGTRKRAAARTRT
jgi:rhodanese-related sulfurtransferase/DNA-binding transcriptional ArsR family regulator